MSEINNLKYASFFLRIIAAIIDYILIRISFYLASLLLSFEASNYFNQRLEIIDFWGSVAVFIYYTFTESSFLQGSLGKIIIGLKIIPLYTGEKRLSFVRAIGRNLAKSVYILVVYAPLVVAVELNNTYRLPIWLEILKLLCFLIFIIGCVAPFRSPEQRTLYDLICGTYVVKK